MNNIKNINLYLHWPWCSQKCPYCDFNVRGLADTEVSSQSRLFSVYAEALVREYELLINTYGPRTVSSIFIGGGTPSTIPQRVLADAIDGITNVNKHSLGSAYKHPDEITIELNPEHVTQQLLESYLDIGITRLSFGVQSFDEQDLNFLGRRHSPLQAINVIELAGQMNFNSYNIDLIFGSPNQTITTWKNNLAQCIDLNVPHISTYQLTIEPNTLFYKAVKNNKWVPLEDNKLLTYMLHAEEVLEKNGYAYYEISNAAKSGHESLHNMAIWNYGEYWGLGAGAHGRIHENGAILASNNIKPPKAYVERVLNDTPAFSALLPLSAHEKALEFLLCKLRLRTPLNVQHIRKYYPHSKFENLSKSVSLDKLVDAAYIDFTNDTLNLTPKGRYVMDSVAEELHKIFLHTSN